MKTYLPLRRMQKELTPARWKWWSHLSPEEMILRIRINRSKRMIKAYKAILTEIGWDSIPAIGISMEHKKIKAMKAVLPKGRRVG